MKINVQVKIRSKKESVEKKDETHYIVRVKAEPIEGKANKRVIELLADYFQIAKSNIELTSGLQSKQKRFLIHF